MDDLLKMALEAVKPSKEESARLESISKEIIDLLESAAKAEKANVMIVLGGSAGRGTWMSGNCDLDFFMRFENEKSIEESYKKIVKKVFKDAVLIHGTRDYYKLKYHKFDVELIPSVRYDSPGKAKNSTDASFFHIQYLKKKFEENPKLRNEVLLLKQFMKANEVYGAESARGGFSGYVCELLIIYLKSFKQLLKFFDKEQPKIIIDIEKAYKDNEEVIKNLDDSKLHGPLIIVDPLMPKRNASASVSYAAFSEFLFRARYLLRQPMMKLFNARGLKMKLVRERSKRRGTKLVSFDIKEERSDFDVTKAKVLSKMKSLALELEREGWKVYNYGVTDDKKLFFEFESLKVSRSKKHYGPFVWAEAENFESFFKKWEGNVLGKPYTFENKLVVDVYRKEDVSEIIREGVKEFLC